MLSKINITDRISYMKKNTRQSKSKFYAPLAVLVFCLTMIAVSRGMGETYGVFLLPISETFQWNRASVTSVFSIYMVSFGLGSFLSGIVFDRLGPKFNYIIGLLMLASCYGFAGRLDSLPAFCLVVGVCGGVGSALVGIVPTQSLIARWFKRRRAAAMSIAYSGQGLGVMLLAPAAQIAIDAYGWKGAYELASLGFIGCFTVILLMPWRRIANGAITPAASPLTKDRALKNKLPDQNIKPAIKELSLREAIRRPEFWGFFTIFGATAIAVFGISLQTVAYLIDQGFEPVFAAFSFGLIGMLTIAGIAITGILAERFPRHIIATCSYGLTVLGVIALACLQVRQSEILLAIFIVCVGISAGAGGPIITTQMAELFAGRGLASIFGATGVGNGCGAAIGAFLAGLSYDITGGYSLGFFISLIFLCIGMSMFWLIPGIKNNQIK